MGSVFDRLSFELIEEIVRFAVAQSSLSRPTLQRLQRVCRSFVAPCRKWLLRDVVLRCPRATRNFVNALRANRSLGSLVRTLEIRPEALEGPRGLTMSGHHELLRMLPSLRYLATPLVPFAPYYTASGRWKAPKGVLPPSLEWLRLCDPKKDRDKDTPILQTPPRPAFAHVWDSDSDSATDDDDSETAPVARADPDSDLDDLVDVPAGPVHQATLTTLFLRLTPGLGALTLDSIPLVASPFRLFGNSLHAIILRYTPLEGINLQMIDTSCPHLRAFELWGVQLEEDALLQLLDKVGPRLGYFGYKSVLKNVESSTAHLQRVLGLLPHVRSLELDGTAEGIVPFLPSRLCHLGIQYCRDEEADFSFVDVSPLRDALDVGGNLASLVSLSLFCTDEQRPGPPARSELSSTDPALNRERGLRLFRVPGFRASPHALDELVATTRVLEHFSSLDDSHMYGTSLDMSQQPELRVIEIGWFDTAAYDDSLRHCMTGVLFLSCNPHLHTIRVAFDAQLPPQQYSPLIRRLPSLRLLEFTGSYPDAARLNADWRRTDTLDSIFNTCSECGVELVINGRPVTTLGEVLRATMTSDDPWLHD